MIAKTIDIIQNQMIDLISGNVSVDSYPKEISVKYVCFSAYLSYFLKKALLPIKGIWYFL